MNKPLSIVNFKTYQRAQGHSAEVLVRAMGSVQTDARLVAAVSALDLSSVVDAAPNLEVWCSIWTQ